MKTNLFMKTVIYSYEIDDYPIDIKFQNGKFEYVSYPFIGPYSRRHWKILSKINSLITKLEKGQIYE